MQDRAHSLLTTTEAANYLRLKPRKLYELVSDGAIPCTKVTGKWLFPRGDLDRWLLAGLARPHGLVPAEPPPIIGGSHDPLLQWALSEVRAGLAILPEGSKRGLRRFIAGEVLAAAIHFHDVDKPDLDTNLDIVTKESSLYDSVLIEFAKRDQGLLTASGNPLGLTCLADVAEKSARMAFRPVGAGAQQLLLALMKREKLPASRIKPALTAHTGADVAQAIRTSHVDCGIGTRALATVAGLGFVPLSRERFDLLVRQRDSYREPLQKLLSFFKTQSFIDQAQEFGGLDVSNAGAVRWAP